MRIAVDAGHGPNTPGKRCPDDSMREYAFNSVTARYAIELLKGFEGVLILTTFEDGRDVPIDDRWGKANHWGADILVSIHANGFGSGWNDAHGIETLIDDPDKGDSPAQAKAAASSVILAKIVQGTLVKATGLQDRGLVDTDGIGILNYAKMTRILVECGFMTNKVEAALLKSDEYRRKCAAAIVAGIVEFAGLKLKEGDDEKLSTVPVIPKVVKLATNQVIITGEIVDGRIVAPIAPVLDAAGVAYKWDNSTKKLYLL